MIDRQTIDRIMGAADIVEVVSEFVTLRKAGSNWKGLCPFHNEKTPSFMVSPSKGICKCFSCGKGGNVAHFLMLHEQLTYPEALRWLAAKYHIDIQERELTAEDIRQNNLRESLLVVNRWAADYFQNALYHTDEGQSIGMAYFRQRGLRDDTIMTFRLGYCPSSGDALAKQALKEGHGEDFLIETGLCIKNQNGTLRDKYRSRVVFPIQALDGKVIAFGARTLSNDKNVAKYMNSPESTIYHKSDVLYGIHQAKSAIQRADRCYLVEGYMDVIAMYQNGIQNVVASSGTSLTFGQIRLIHRFTSNLTILYDGDMAGIKASLRGIDMLLEEGMNIRVLLLPDGDDPDSFSRKHDPEAYQTYINDHQMDFIRFKADILLKDAGDDPIRKSQVTRSMVESIAVIPDALTRSIYIKECSALLEEREEVLISETARARRRHYEEKQREREREEARSEELPQMGGVVEAISPTPLDSQNDSPSVTHPTLPISEDTLRSRKEAQLIKAIIRHGEKVIGYTSDENEEGEHPLTVTDFIHAELQTDHLAFENPLYQKVMDEAMQHLYEPDFNASRYFMMHPDPQMSQLAADMMSDRYQLSETFARDRKITAEAEKLEEIVPILVIDLKLTVVTAKMKELLHSLQDPTIYHDHERYTQTMKNIQRLKALQKQFTALGGDRTIMA